MPLKKAKPLVRHSLSIKVVIPNGGPVFQRAGMVESPGVTHEAQSGTFLLLRQQSPAPPQQVNKNKDYRNPINQKNQK